MNPSESYIELCIKALPPERQDKARQVCREMSEGGEGTFLDRLLVLLDASGAYAKTIPSELKSVADSLFRELEALRSRDAADRSSENNLRENQLRQILTEQMPLLAKGLSVTRLAEGLEAQNAHLGRLEHSVSSMRYLRVGGLLLLMGISALIGAASVGGYFYRSYQTGQQSQAWLEYYENHGIHLDFHETAHTVVLSVSGQRAVLDGTAYRNNDQGKTIGVDLIYPK